jgi:hypothetical protein
LCIQFLIRRLDILAVTARRRRLEQKGTLVWEEEKPKIPAIDGKMSRGSKRNKSGREAVKGIYGKRLVDGRRLSDFLEAEKPAVPQFGNDAPFHYLNPGLNQDKRIGICILPFWAHQSLRA